MAEFVEDIDLIRGSQDSIEVEIVSDDEFKMLDEAIQNAMEEGWFDISPHHLIITQLYFF